MGAGGREPSQHLKPAANAPADRATGATVLLVKILPAMLETLGRVSLQTIVPDMAKTFAHVAEVPVARAALLSALRALSPLPCAL